MKPPVYSGFVKYFPRAMVAVADHSRENNEKHNPGEPLHWSKHKSNDHANSLMRHLLKGDWVAVAWRAMALLETELEAEENE
jgi:hypothetical protein